MNTISRHHRGITLIEVIIVLAISSMLIVIAAGFLRNNGRSDFDNSMRQLTNEIRAVQNEANTGIGPDPTTYDCPARVDSFGVPLSGYPAAGKQACPYAPYIDSNGQTQPTFAFGRSLSFGHATNDANFGNVSVGGNSLGLSYFVNTLGFKPKLAVNVFAISSTPQVKQLPANVGFLGYCVNDTSCNTFTNTNTSSSSNPATTVFGRVNLSADLQSLPNNGVANFAAGSALTRGFPLCKGISTAAVSACSNGHTTISGSGSCGTAMPDTGYFDSYSNVFCPVFGTMVSQQTLTLRFTDTATAKLKAIIVINPSDNSVNLRFQ